MKKHILLKSLIAVLIISTILNSIGLGWGRSGFVPWHADSIEGITTIREMPRLFGQWTYKYPQGQFLINAVFYKPLLNKWKKNPVKVISREGRVIRSVLNQPRLDSLAAISRLIAVAMAIGTVAAVFMIARLLFADYLSAVLAALALAFCQLFVFYGHMGTPDIPCLFWFTWGLYWAVKSIYIGKWRHFALMGFFFSFSLCTKDPMVGYIIGMVPAFWLAMTGKAKTDGQNLKTAILSVFSKKVLVAILVFLLTYGILQNIFTHPQVFITRMSHWIGGPGVVNFNKDFKGQLPLFLSAIRMIYTSFGWPLLTVIVISLIYFTINNPWLSGLFVIPLISFYVIVVMNVHMVGPRYLLPVFGGLALIAGKGCADWLRKDKIHIAVRILPVAFVYTCSLLYCIGLDLEFLNDSRIRTEKWFVANVDRDIPIASLIRIHYEPRLHLRRFPYARSWKIPADKRYFNQITSLPEYIIASDAIWTNHDQRSQALRRALLNKQLNYEQVVGFNCKYLTGPKYLWLRLAGRPFDNAMSLSPEMTVFKKTD